MSIRTSGRFRGRVMQWTCCLLVAGCPVAASPMPGLAQLPPGPLWGSLEPGPHGAGFTRSWELDPTRVWPRSEALDSLGGQVARPVRIDVWYPAMCGTTAPMRLGHYVKMDAPAPVFADLVFLTHRWDAYSYRGLAKDTATYERLMSTPTSACPDAVPASGRFPLIVYSAGWFNRTPDNTVLAEFLATHGFVVAAVPQINPGLWTFNFASDARAVENQIRDLELALGAMMDAPNVDRRRIAAMGYSTGGDVALLLQGRNPLVDVVVGLDASWSLGPDNDVIESPFFAPESHRVPILVARRPAANRSGADDLLNRLTAAPRVVVEIPGGDHGSFADDPALRKLLGIRMEEDPAARERVAATVLVFLRATLGRGGEVAGEGLAQLLAELDLPTRYLPATLDSLARRP